MALARQAEAARHFNLKLKAATSEKSKTIARLIMLNINVRPVIMLVTGEKEQMKGSTEEEGNQATRLSCWARRGFKCFLSNATRDVMSTDDLILARSVTLSQQNVLPRQWICRVITERIWKVLNRIYGDQTTQ